MTVTDPSGRDSPPPSFLVLKEQMATTTPAQPPSPTSSDGADDDDNPFHLVPANDCPNPPPLTPPPPPSLLHWSSVLLLGLLTNIPFFVLTSSAQSLAQSFDALPLIGLIQWASVILGTLTRLMNGLLLLNTSAFIRVIAACLLCMIGLCLLTLSPFVGFGLAIASITLIGMYGAWCECVILAFIRRLHLSMLSGWSTGTGLSGVVGSVAYILLHSVWGLSNRLIYALLIPSCIVYVVTFSSLIHATPLPASPPPIAVKPSLSGSTQEPTPADIPQWRRAMRVGGQVASLTCFLGGVYFFEFVILVGFASAANPGDKGQGWWYNNSYEVLSFCYQLGMLAGRGSLPLFQINAVWALTVIQGVNWVVWLAQAWMLWMPLWMQYGHMVVVGLVGGVGYCNTFRVLREDGRVEERDRELAINLVATGYNGGIIAASLFETVVLKLLLQKQSG